MKMRPINTFLALVILATSTLTGCGKKVGTDVEVPEESGPKWGFIDHAGKFVIKPEFRRVKRFTEGLAGADLHARWGFIDRDGKFVIARAYEDVQPFSAGYAGVEIESRWYVINKTGEVLWPPDKSVFKLGFPHEVDADAEDHAVVVPWYDGKKWGFHDFGPHGKGDIRCQWDDVKYFNDGLCPVYDAKKMLWGFINNKGEMVIDFKFDSASAFKNRVAECMMGDDFVWVDKIGTIAKKSRLESIHLFKDGLALQQKRGKFIFIKRTGDPAFKKRFRYADNFSEGLAVVQPLKTGKRGYVDRTGEMVIPPVFEEARAFSEQLAAVRVDPERFFKEYNDDLSPKNGAPKEEGEITPGEAGEKAVEEKAADGGKEEGGEGKGEGEDVKSTEGGKADGGKGSDDDEKSEGGKAEGTKDGGSKKDTSTEDGGAGDAKGKKGSSDKGDGKSDKPTDKASSSADKKEPAKAK